MMKKISILILFILSLYGNEYLNVAQNFLKYRGIDKDILGEVVLKSDNQDTIGYLYSLENGGYIVVSASKEGSPIKNLLF